MNKDKELEKDFRFARYIYVSIYLGLIILLLIVYSY
jgi:hypothetical protein